MRDARAVVVAAVLVASATGSTGFEAQSLGEAVKVPVAPGRLSQTGLYTADGIRHPPSLGPKPASFGETRTADDCRFFVGAFASAGCGFSAFAAEGRYGETSPKLGEIPASGGGPFAVSSRNRPFSPQYPLWSDGAAKSRWVYLPEGATIDTTDVDAWEFPIGTRFWKEFQFGGRRVETRLLWRASAEGWVFASYVWNAEQTDAVLAPVTGVSNVAQIAPGRSHSIPSVADCRACHDSGRTEILGFDALQLSTDRDPNAPHGEPLTTEMITLQMLVDEGALRPSRTEWIAQPPRIAADDAKTRAALGYLSANCGSCHNRRSSIASLGLVLKHSVKSPAECTTALATALDRPGHWVVPDAPEGESRLIRAGHPELSAIVRRTASRRPSSQMPPLGSVLVDKTAVDLLTAWVRDDPEKWAARSTNCRIAMGSDPMTR